MEAILPWPRAMALSWPRGRQHFIGPFGRSGGRTASPAAAGSPRGAQTSPPAGTRPWRGGKPSPWAASGFPRAGRTPRGLEGVASQRGRGKAPRCGAGWSPPAGKMSARDGRMSPRGGTRSPRWPLPSPRSGWIPPGPERAFPERVRPFYGGNGARLTFGGPTAPRSPKDYFIRWGATSYAIVTQAEQWSRVPRPTWRHRDLGAGRPQVPWEPWVRPLESTVCPRTAPRSLSRASPEPVRVEAGAGRGGTWMGGATRPLAKLCPPPHPTLPRGRKGTPGLPDLPRFPDPDCVGLLGTSRVTAGDGRGRRYGDRWVALRASCFVK